MGRAIAADTFVVPRHHFVPQMYLRRFADRKRRLVLVDRDDLRQREVCTAKQALQQDDFYGWRPGLEAESVDDPAMLDPEFVEKFFSTMESRAAPALHRVLTTDRPPESAKDLYHLTNFIALQAARGRRFREDLSQVATIAMRQHMRSHVDRERTRDWLARAGIPHGDVEVDAFLAEAYGPGGPRLVPDQALAIQHSLRFALQQLAPSLWDRSWLLVNFEAPCLLTSDEPVVAFHPDDEPVSAITAPVVLFALDRLHLLALRTAPPRPSDSVGPERGAEGVVLASRDGSLEEARRFNTLVATQAERHIVVHPDDQRLLDDLDVGPRTAWGEEVLDAIDEGDRVRIRKRVRRLPVE